MEKVLRNLTWQTLETLLQLTIVYDRGSSLKPYQTFMPFFEAINEIGNYIRQGRLKKVLVWVEDQ